MYGVDLPSGVPAFVSEDAGDLFRVQRDWSHRNGEMLSRQRDRHGVPRSWAASGQKPAQASDDGRLTGGRDPAGKADVGVEG